MKDTDAAKWKAQKRQQSKAQKRQQVDHLYVMKYDNDDAVAKIGRSHNVENRRKAQEAGQHFRVEPLAIFPSNGHLEPLVHKRLEEHRSHLGAGTEWFRIKAAEAVEIVNKLLQEIELEKSKVVLSS